MAARMTRCQWILKSSLTQRNSPDLVLCNENQKMSCLLVAYASLHTQRKVTKQLPILASRLLRCHRQTSMRTQVMSARWNSSAVNSASTTASTGFINPPDYVPPAPPIPTVSESSPLDLAESFNALGEPTLHSLGLGSYWPPGLVQQALEYFHVSLGLPWWGSIVFATIIIRVCMFPVVVKAQKLSIKMTNHMPTIQKLQLKFTQARQRGNMIEAMRYGNELGEYIKRNDVKMYSQFMMPFVQMPVFMSFFFGMRQMANLPVESMKTGGLLWFPDLTIATQWYGMPLMTSLTLLLTIEVGADGVTTQSQQHMMKWFLRAMPCITLPIIANFPAAMLVYWFTSNSFSLLQVLFLKIPAVRTAFKMPERVIHPIEDTKKKGFLEGFQDSWGNMKAANKVMERQRLDEVAYRKAAQGPIIKTYSYNPKKVQKSSAKSKTNVISDK